MAQARDSLAPNDYTQKEEANARTNHSWAVEIVTKRFEEGLNKVFESAFVDRRFVQFARRADPVYATLLEGMNDEGVARTMVGNWMVAHTLATQARFWLEDAIVDLLYKKAARQPKPQLRPRIYSLGMLGDGWYTSNRSIWDVGEKWREEIHGRKGWSPPIQEGALNAIDRIVAGEEREYESRHPDTRAARIGSGAISEQEDDAALQRAVAALSGRPRPTLVRCNLLFIEPEKSDGTAQASAIRYINPTTFNQAATIRGERVNLLRLRAYLAQEKPFRAPGKIQVIAADLVPRGAREDSNGRAASHFSARTRWNADQLWEFLGVPFAAVTAGIRAAGKAAGDRLGAEVRRLGTGESAASD